MVGLHDGLHRPGRETQLRSDGSAGAPHAHPSRGGARPHRCENYLRLRNRLSNQAPAGLFSRGNDVMDNSETRRGKQDEEYRDQQLVSAGDFCVFYD